MSFFGTEIPPEMFLQIMAETGDIIPVHRRIGYGTYHGFILSFCKYTTFIHNTGNVRKKNRRYRTAGTFPPRSDGRRAYRHPVAGARQTAEGQRHQPVGKKHYFVLRKALLGFFTRVSAFRNTK